MQNYHTFETIASCMAHASRTPLRPRIQVHPDRLIPSKITVIPPSAVHPVSAFGSGIHIHAALDFMRKTDAATFVRIIRRMWQFADLNERRSLVYSLVLFRGEAHVKRLLSGTGLPADFTDAIVHEAASRGFSDEYENEALEEILGFLSQDSLYDLAIREHEAGKNRTVLYILLRMDVKHLDRYFEDPSRVRIFITSVCAIPERLIKSFFFKNPKLHGYYVFLFNTVDSSSIRNAAELYAIDLSEVEAVKKIAIGLSLRFDLENEMSLPLARRDKDRFAHIVNSIRHFKDIPRVLESLIDENVIDSDEKSLIEEILGNPLFRDVLEKYSSAPKLEESAAVEFML